MRYLGVAVAALMLATGAQAQLWQSQSIVLGAAASTTWELNPESRPGQTAFHNTTIQPSVFAGVSVMSDTLIRLRLFDLPHEQVIGTNVVDSRMRGVAVGVDYLMLSVFGRTVLSGGVGTYKLDLEGNATGSDKNLETWDFGWFVGVGEWVPMSKNTNLTFEFAYHQTNHPDRPQFLNVSLGLAYSF
jgi:hypothetical protein